jgi:N-acetyl-anhydromuramyl-L-alanine amidase AmpD
MGADYPPAEWRPSPSFWQGRAGSKVDGIILHGTAGGDGPGVASYLSQASTGASVHFVIGQDGHIFQLVALADSAWGNGIPQRSTWPLVAQNAPANPNLYTVSIEHAKASTDNSDALTPAQMDASVALVGWLLCELGPRGLASDAFLRRLAADDLATLVTSHASIDAVDRARCPGTFDWSGYYTRLRAARAHVASLVVEDAMTDAEKEALNQWAAWETFITALGRVGDAPGFAWLLGEIRSKGCAPALYEVLGGPEYAKSGGLLGIIARQQAAIDTLTARLGADEKIAVTQAQEVATEAHLAALDKALVALKQASADPAVRTAPSAV